MGDRVVVMGGGSSGTSVFYHLAKFGFKDVVLVEERCLGCGQTGYSSAIIRTQYSHDETRKMAVYSWRFLRERFNEETGCESPVFHEIGVAYGAGDDQYEEVKGLVSKLVEEGVPVELLDPSEFSEKIHPIDTSGLRAVSWEPQGGYGEPHTLVSCFSKAGEELGGTITNDSIVGLDLDHSGRVRGVRLSSGSTIKASYVVNALNVWSNRLLGKYGLEAPLTIAREDVVVFSHPHHRSGPAWADLVLGFYSRGEGETSTLVGGLEPEQLEKTANIEPGVYDPIPHDIIIARGVASKRFKYIENSTPKAAWYGFYDITPDWMPILGEDPRAEGLIHVVGLSGHGFKLSPALGKITADIIARGHTDLVNIETYSITRFTKTRQESKFKYKILG